MSAADDLELMQHADGELDERARAGVEQRVASNADDRAKLQGIGDVGELVRSHLELATDDVPARRFDAMWSEIDRQLDRSTAPREASEPGIWARITGWLERYRGHVITGTVSAGAVAVLALILRPDARERVEIRSHAIDVQPAALRMAPEIESLDTPEGEGTVLNIEDEDGHTTVIWVSPADTVEGI